MSFIAAAVIVGGATVASAAANYFASNNAADAAENAAEIQAAAADKQAQNQWDVYNKNVALAKPWRDAGIQALDQISGLTSNLGQGFLADFTGADYLKYQDPSYAWRLKQGQAGIEAQAGAQGLTGSGTLGVALSDYNQNAASQEYGNAYNRWMNSQNTFYNRLAGLSGTGQAQTNAITAMGSNTVNNVGQLGMAGANALAAGQINSANAYSSGLNGISNAFTSGAGVVGNMMNQQYLASLLGGGNSTFNLANTGYGQAVTGASNYWASNPEAYYALYGGYEKGGTPPVGVPVVVGEKGPEIAVFHKPATIIPNNQIRNVFARRR